MKKSGVWVILLILVFASLSVVVAATNSTNSTTTNTTITSTSSSSDDESDSEKIDNGFECLEEKVGSCSGLSVQEIALTILATPDDDTFDDCVDELESRKSSDHWGNVRDTALSVLALQHAGEDTEASEEWLLKQEKTPTDLVWFMEQDSNAKSECHIKYDANDYSVLVEENKKIDKNAGSCLTRAQSNFWLKISPDCYEKEFQIECDQQFIATLLYKNQNAPTIYVLEGTESAPAYGSITLNVRSKCFGDSSCDYEATAWATLALLETGHDIEDYIPYIIAMSDTNERFLPKSFIYMATNYEDYATQLVGDQKLGNYWEADSTAYNKFYDTSLAIIAIGKSSSEQVTKAKDWLLFSQGSSGCWQNSVRDTAIVLWALAGRSGRSGSGDGSGVTYCSQANFFCIANSECPSDQDLGDSYFCSSLSDTCCKTENLKACSVYGGQECSSGTVCVGIEKKATDTNKCCTGECTQKSQETECEANFFTCMSQCSDLQESAGNYACDGAEVCCKAKTTTESGGSSWWIWVLVVLIIVVALAIGYVKRDNLKLFMFKLKSKFRKDKGHPSAPSRPSGPGPGFPPRPGFPPIRRMPPIQGRPPQARNYDRRDPEMNDTFKRLREIADKK